jgi:citrate lyase subunit beta/citryl-CoA lyase
MDATTYLFVPATRPERIEKALATSADVVIVDLEDAVGPDDKSAARDHLGTLTPSRPCYIRINDVTSEYFNGDVAFLNACAWVSGVILSKVQSREQIAHLMGLLERDVVVDALVESAQGILAADDIANSGVHRLILGSADYSSELGVEPTEQLLAYPRSRLAVASAAARIARPVDGPTLELENLERIESDTLAARRLGMGAKLCVHPRQLPVVASVFGSLASQEEWARSVLSAFEASGGGVTSLNGEMIDAPVAARARTILESR